MSDHNSEMSPLLTALMMVLHRGAIGAAALMALFIGIEIYKHITPDHQLVIEGNDRGFLGVLVVILAFALYLVWSIGRQLKKPRA
ncbi:MAG: hypothetical protein KGO94_09630 [Alphaproteobacteria bacterium]|nr:hypothetical protein [Alphaproteobacteria bacterium]